MKANRRLSICVALLTVSGLATACRATTPARAVPPLAAGQPTHDGPPRSDIWITYSPTGLVSSSAPNAKGSETVTVGHLRPAIFSARIRSIADDDMVEADVLMPAGFDRRYVRAEDIREDDRSSDPYSNGALRGVRLDQTLMHHRPPVRLRIDTKGDAHVESTPELRRHETCQRRLLRSAAEARLATAQNDVQKRSQQQRLEGLENDLARTSSSHIENAALLLRAVTLSLPTSADGEDAQVSAEALGGVLDQFNWRAEQIRFHGRPVRLRLDLLAATSSPAASLCRSLPFQEISEPRSDTCTIEGAIDQRDRWPLTLTISRKGETAGGATESHSRRFDRITLLQGFVPPANPCAAQ